MIPKVPPPSFLETITASLKQFFNPGGGQIFSLQFPGRFLQISEYAWDSTSAGVFGQFIKPVAVNESEFRLTDQLYDVAEVVSGPNGVNLSIVYEQLLNNLLPVFQDTGLGAQQNQIRKWLLTDVQTSPWIQQLIMGQTTTAASSTIPSTTASTSTTTSASAAPSFALSNKLLGDSTVNRMELSNALMQEYLTAKQAWELERDTMIQKAMAIKLGTPESQAALNDLTRTLAHTTATREAQLASKYADAVVRGYSHNVREYTGYMDIKSSAESLQDAKDSLREAAMSSLDGSLSVYPVQMTPIDWFNGLSTSFTLEDLTSDPDLIKQQIDAKSKQLDTLNQQLVALQASSQGNVDKLQATVTIAQQTLDDANANLAMTYTNNVLSLAKTCIDSHGDFDSAQLDTLAAAPDTKLASDIVTSLKQDMPKTCDAQKALTSASRAYSQALAGLALAQATDTQQTQEQIRLQIASITADLNELTARYQALNAPNTGPVAASTTGSINDIQLFPTANNDTSGGSRWQELTMSQTIMSDYSAQSSSASASQTSMNCNLWFASYSSSSSSSAASSSSTTSQVYNDVTVGLRATLVTVDRAGWFQPQFFKQSGSFYHIDGGVSWSKWPQGVDTMSQLVQPTRTNWDAINSNLLPAYPIGFIVCKVCLLSGLSLRKADGIGRISQSKSLEERLRTRATRKTWPPVPLSPAEFCASRIARASRAVALTTATRCLLAPTAV